MPNWKRLVAEGYTAQLESFLPILSPIVWTTLATGVGPDVHRVLDFQEVDPATGQKVPISGRSRAVPAIWNVASASGLTVGVVGWWATHPAEEVKGFFVSDHASPILFEGAREAGRRVSGVARRRASSRSSRATARCPTRSSRASSAMPAGGDRGRARGRRRALRTRSSRSRGRSRATRVQSRIARELYDRNLPDLTMLYLEGTDVIGHLFAADVPPRMGCVAGRRLRPVPRDRGRVLRAGRPADRPVDAARRGGRRDADRQLRPRLQVGRGPLLRARVAATRAPRRSGTGSTASSPRGARACRASAERGQRVASSTSSRRSPRCSAFPSIAKAPGAPIRAAFRDLAAPRAQGPRRGGPGPAPGRRADVGEGSERVREEAAGARLPLRQRAGQARAAGRRPAGADRGGLEQPRALPLRARGRGNLAARARPRTGRRSRCGPDYASPEAQPRGAPARPAARTGRRSTGSSSRSPPGTRIRRARSSTGRSPTT